MKVIASTSLYLLRYEPKTVIPPVAKRYLGSPIHPLQPKIAHMYAHRDPNTLWWRVAIHPLQQYRRVVRSWGARRTRLAFQQALEARGFDREGRRIEDSTRGAGKTTATGKNGNLVGSVEILVKEASIKEKFPTIQKEMSSIVDTLLRSRRQQQDSSNNPNKRKKRERAPDIS